MERYDWKKYYGYMVQGDLRAATEYIKKFGYKKGLVKKTYKRFEGDYVVRSKSKVINEIDAIFQEYYRAVFWKGVDLQVAELAIYNSFARRYSLELLDKSDYEKLHMQYCEYVEPLIEKEVVAEGYHYLGGDTQGYLGPYIWKKTKERIYSVELPNGKSNFTVKMMSGFVSRSWMSFISFDVIGTGGWAEKDGMCCVKKVYFKKMLSSRFWVDFLKHEAQHAVDLRNDPDMPSVHLEYRAKLVQLIYAEDMKAFTGFLAEADGKNPNNSHTYASFLLVRNLSRKVFDKEIENDIALWRKNRKKLKASARELFFEYPQHME